MIVGDIEVKNIVKFLSIPFSASLATFIGDFITYPLETITTFVKKSHYPRHAYEQIWQKTKTQNWKFFLHGIDTVFYSAFFTNFVYFGVYEGFGQITSSKTAKNYFKDYTWLLPTVGSLIAETASLLVLIPIDCVQTRIQSNLPAFRYKGLWHGLRSIRKKEGFGRFFLGSHLYMVHNLMFTPIIFTIYERYKKQIISERKAKPFYEQYNKYDQDHLFTLQDSIKGTLLATTISTLLTNPLYTILIRFQVVNYSQAQYMNERIWYIIKSSYRFSGFRGLNVGLVPRMVTANFSACLYIPVYEYFRTRFGSSREF